MFVFLRSQVGSVHFRKKNSFRLKNNLCLYFLESFHDYLFLNQNQILFRISLIVLISVSKTCFNLLLPLLFQMTKNINYFA